MAVSLFVIAKLLFGGLVPGTEGTKYAEPWWTDEAIYWSYILLGITTAVVIVFTVLGVFKTTKTMIMTAIVIGVMAIVVVVANSLASDAILEDVSKFNKDNNPETLKLVGTGLFTMYILIGASVLAILYTEITKLFK
jgi:hypothetical protein